jgi:hypothetical protein
MKLRHCAIQVCFEHSTCRLCRQPLAQDTPRCAQEAAQSRAGVAERPDALVDEHEIQREFVEFLAPAIQILNAMLYGVLGNRMTARRSLEWLDATLAQVLVHATGLVEKSDGCFETVDDVAALRLREAFVVDASQSVHEAYMTGFGQKRVIVDETPQRQEAIYAAGVPVVPDDALDP